MEKNVIVKNDFNKIISRAGDINSLDFKTIGSKELEEINNWMPIVNEKTSSFQRQNSQTTLSLMTLNMIDSAPYRVLRQILAQVEKRRGALKEVIYEIEKKKIKYDELNNKGKLTKLEELEINKIKYDIIDSKGYIEGALKELGALKRRYEEICINKNIPEDWNEEDFEKQEIEHHIKSMFRNGIRDRLQGSHNVGTMEYFSQFGINSITAYILIDGYIKQMKEAIINGVFPTIDSEYEFLDKAYDMFKDEYKKAAKRIGLDSIIQADFLMKDNK